MRKVLVDLLDKPVERVQLETVFALSEGVVLDVDLVDDHDQDVFAAVDPDLWVLVGVLVDDHFEYPATEE